ncbi:hypothetical protein DBV15_08229 [Temnothorax longispinosus]|uniref:Uncharacterized protein n=1 Tax=Temnothorax longispinosus TaxID=300112 RepID=A0A4S2KKP5_9HYME|nr:hypothetical protein DBV15_08229 [Temnothorax longispinosus]
MRDDWLLATEYGHERNVESSLLDVIQRKRGPRLIVVVSSGSGYVALRQIPSVFPCTNFHPPIEEESLLNGICGTTAWFHALTRSYRIADPLTSNSNGRDKAPPRHTEKFRMVQQSTVTIPKNTK